MSTIVKPYHLAEYVDAYLEIEQTTGERMSNADMAADIADNLCAKGIIEVSDEDDADFNLLIHDIERELPYYTGRKK